MSHTVDPLLLAEHLISYFFFFYINVSLHPRVQRQLSGFWMKEGEEGGGGRQLKKDRHMPVEF